MSARWRRTVWAVALLVASAAPGVLGDGPSISVDVRPRQVRQGEAVRVSVVVSGDGAGDAQIAGRPPAGRGLLPAGGISTSQQFSWVNGRSSASKTFEMQYLASEQGRTEVPSFELSIGGRTLRTEPVEIEVLPPGSAAPAGQEPAAELSVEGRLSKQTVYLGESVTIEYVLRRRVEVRGYEPEKLEPVPGFVVEDETIDPGATAREVSDADGVRWIENILFRRHLTPTRTGRLTIPAVAFAFGVLPRQRGPFDLFSGPLVQREMRVAPARVVTVRPLPEEGRPADFTGGVGRFQLQAELSSPDARAGEAVNLVATVSGEGSPGAMSPPLLDLPPDVQTYDPLEESVAGGGRRWVFPVVPRAEGRIRLGGVHFSFFDPDSRRYVSRRAGPLELNVAPGAPAGADAPASAAATPVRAQAADLRFIHPLTHRPVTRLPGLAAARGYGTLALLLALPLPLALGVRLLRDRYLLSASGRRTRQRRAVRQRLARAAKLAEQEPRTAARELLEALHLWAEATCGASLRSMDRARLRRTLAERGGDEERAREVVELVDRAQAQRFAGGDGAVVAQLVRDARRWIEEER